MSKAIKLVTEMSNVLRSLLPVKCANCPQPIAAPPFYICSVNGTRHHARYYHVACRCEDSRPR